MTDREKILIQLVIEYYELLQKVIQNPAEAHRKPGVCGQDQYAGMTPLQKSESIIFNKYHVVLTDILKAKGAVSDGSTS